ncbi:MAG: MCE family protein [Planctomycetes bacterium]|nr:MCE family protein [Planctomycetota bacterium]
MRDDARMDPDRAPTSRDFAIGLTAIGALAGLAGLLLAFGKLQPLLERRFPVLVETVSAQGVRAGSRVTLHGVPVGTVTAVAADPAWDPPVRITVELREDARVPASASVRLAESIVGGASEVSFAVDPGAPRDGPMLARAEPPMSVQGRALGLQERLDLALAGAQSAIDRANGWLGDEALRADVRAAAAKAGTLFDEATDTVQIVGNLAQSVGEDARRLSERLVRAADSLASAMAQVDGIVARVAQGEGTAGKFVADPALYDGLADSVRRLREALDQANALLMQVREKGLQIRVP